MYLPRGARFALVLATASALQACGDDLLPTERAAFCPEPSSQSASAERQAGPRLFALEAAPVLSEQQEQLLAKIRARPTTAEVAIARLHDDAEALLESGQEIVFDVSAAHAFAAVGTRVEQRAPSDLSWSGALVDGSGHVSLILSSSGITATLQSVPANRAATLYGFEPLGGRMHAIICVDATRFLPD